MKTPLVKGMSQKVIAYHPILSKITGKLTSGVLLSQIMYWANTKDGKEFYKTDKEFCEETGLTLDELKAAKKRLIEGGFITVVKRGTPQRSFYLHMVEITEIKLREFHQLDGVNSTNLTVEIPPTNTESTTETTREEPSPSKEEENPHTLPDFLGKTPTARLVTVYGVLYKDLTGFTYQANWPALTKLFKPLLESLSEWQIAAMIALHFNWYGANGDDEFAHKRLASASFPLEWVPNSVNQYRPYIQNHLHVPFDDHESVKKHVTKIIKPLYQTYAK